MSKVIIKNERQLLKFLNMLAEESVNQAVASVSGKDQQIQVAKGIQASKKEFIEEEDPPAQDTQAEPAKPAAPPTPPAGASNDAGSISPKFDSLIDAINDIRGSPSSRDSRVETQLRSYYDKLDSAEAASAILIIRSLSQVMRGEVEGAKAPDPSDYKIRTTMEGSEESETQRPQDAAPAQPVGGQEQPAPEEAEELEEPEEGENTAPPIKVGSEQVSESYRAKIKKLLAQR